MQQRRLLAERDGMGVRQHAHGRADADPPGAPQQQRGQRHRRRADAVRHEVVLGEPDSVEPGLLRHLGGAHRAVQRLPLSLPGELGGQYERSNAHRHSASLQLDASGSPTGINV